MQRILSAAAAALLTLSPLAAQAEDVARLHDDVADLAGATIDDEVVEVAEPVVAVGVANLRADQIGCSVHAEACDLLSASLSLFGLAGHGLLSVILSLLVVVLSER